MGEEKLEEKANENAEQIGVKVLDEHGNETFFKIKKTTVLSKLFAAYAQKKGIQENRINFLMDGARLKAQDTAQAAGLEDGDIIDTKLLQQGGK